MKKIIAFALAAAFAIPSFALTLKVGNSFAYLPTENGKDSVSVVTKIAPAANGTYELVLFANNMSYSYAVAEGEKIELYTKTSAKAKSMTEKKITITAVRNNALEFETSENVVSGTSTSDAK
jgi:hypothetical protein